MHRHRDRQRATGDEIVHHRRHRIDRDFPVETLAGRRVNRVGDEILRPQSLLDVREEVIRGLDEIGALPARRRRLGITVGPQRAGRRLRRLLAGALEGIELVEQRTPGRTRRRDSSRIYDI